MEGQGTANLPSWKLPFNLIMIIGVAMLTPLAMASDSTTEWMWRRNPDYFQPDLCRSYHTPLPRRYYGRWSRPKTHHCVRPPKPPGPIPPPPPPPVLPPSVCPSGKVNVAYVNLVRSNDSFPGSPAAGGRSFFGGMRDKNLQDVWNVIPKTARGSYAEPPADAGGYSLPSDSLYRKFYQYSSNPDIPTFHTRGNSIYMVNHFEFPQPGAMYFSKISQDKATGRLTMTNTERINDYKEGGTWFPCSGTITPWDSHLGSEEYPADCRLYEETMLASSCIPRTAAFTACGWLGLSAYDAGSALSTARLFGGWPMHPLSPDADEVDLTGSGDPDKGLIEFELALGFGNRTVLDSFRSLFNCYGYGYSPEVVIGMDGSYKMIKWLTLGRVSHESALVMPDGKTVYTTDDGSNCGFFMFKASKVNDLSSGTLYAAKWTEDGAVDKFKVTWIKLGAANQAELEAIVASKPNFSDIFDQVNPLDGSLDCPAGYKAANTPTNRFVWPEQPAPGGPTQVYLECLKVKPGMAKAAAFLETRRYAAMLGATTEFEKEEGVTFSKARMEMYVAYTSVDKGMTANPKYSYGRPGDVAMPENKCGVIMTYKLNKDYTATFAEPLIYGKPITPDGDGNKCDLDAVANPDNIFYSNNIMFIAEDTSSHFNNVLWAYDMRTKTLARILSSPQYAEVTGIYISYVGDFAYLALAMQHPEENTPDEGLNLNLALAQRGYVGYIGPLSAACLKSGKTPVFESIPAAKTAEEKKSVLSTRSVTYI